MLANERAAESAWIVHWIVGLRHRSQQFDDFTVILADVLVDRHGKR